MGKLTISMAIFNSYVSHYQRVLADMSKLIDLWELISDQLRSKIFHALGKELH